MNPMRGRARVAVVQAVVVALMATLFVRLWFLQVVASETYAAAASANSVREVVTPASRGLILDVTGRPLVRNRTDLVVSVDRFTLERRPDKGAAVLERLGRVLETDAGDLRARIRLCKAGVAQPCWSGSPYAPVPVARDIDPATALQIMERREDFPGVEAAHVSAREYPAPEGANAAHLLGYLQPADSAEMAAQTAAGRLDARLQREDLVGRAGLEKQYDELLRGEPGVSHVAVDHLGRVLGPVDETPPIPGNNLVTTIDARVQALAEKQLAAALARAQTKPDFRGRVYPADSGSVVVLDVNTGAIVAMASAPTYDPQVWVGGIDSEVYADLTGKASGIPLLARAYAGGGAPGSTFKVISTAAAAMDRYSLTDYYGCPSSITVGDREFSNFESKAYGGISLKRALEVSCDTVFYKLAHEMWLRDGGISPKANPKDPMQEMARGFGLGALTGIDLPGESPGRIVDRDAKRAAWEATKAATCKRAENGYPDVAAKQPKRAKYLQRLAKENCADGHAFRAGDAVNFSIGQGETVVTPLQLARVYAALANGGTLVRPHLAKAELSPTGEVVREFAPEVTGKVPVSDTVLDYISKALVGVSKKGTAAGVYRDWPHKKTPVAAKTGTAEKYGEEPTSWFASYAPADKPRYAVIMTVSQGGTGSGTSGPSVRKITEALLGVGRDPVLPKGPLPLALPVARPDGTFGRPK